MSALVPLHFESADVRMIVRDGEPWWVLADVAAALGLSNPTMLANRLADYQKADLSIAEGSSNQRRRMNIINEAGVYALTLNSRKPTAQAFARWLFTEILPSIRRWGQYPPPVIEEKDDRPFLINGPAVQMTRQQRFLEEARLYEARTGYSLFDIPGLSKQRVKAIELGASISKTLGRGDLWIVLMSAGFDLYYIMFGDRRRARLRAENPFTGDW